MKLYEKHAIMYMCVHMYVCICVCSCIQMFMRMETIDQHQVSLLKCNTLLWEVRDLIQLVLANSARLSSCKLQVSPCIHLSGCWDYKYV